MYFMELIIHLKKIISKNLVETGVNFTQDLYEI
jgi:hypothetical protein